MNNAELVRDTAKMHGMSVEDFIDAITTVLVSKATNLDEIIKQNIDRFNAINYLPEYIVNYCNRRLNRK